MRREQDLPSRVLREAAEIVYKADARYDSLLYPPNWPRMMREFIGQYPDSAIRIGLTGFGLGVGIGATLFAGVHTGFLILTSLGGLGFGQMAVDMRRLLAREN